MHELRRRFAINGGEDDVTPIDLEAQRVFVGLPAREGRLLAELLRVGDIGVELSMDPIAPIVVGVFPIRPVPRS
jgi:predicted dienelactone hydrolase